MVHTVHIRIFFSVFINNIDLIYFFYSSSSVQKEKERDQVSDQWNWTELNTITRNSQWRGWCALMCSTVEKREKSNKQTNLFQSTTKTYTYEPLPLIFCCSFAQPRAHPSVHILYLKIILQTNKFQNSFFCALQLTCHKCQILWAKYAIVQQFTRKEKSYKQSYKQWHGKKAF